MDNLSENSGDMLVSQSVEWTPEHEQILIEWADKAMCYRWLHSKANILFSRLNAWYTIPVIIISTLTGTANFAQGRVPLEYQNYFVMLVGGFNLLAGIITTIQQFLKITQLNESHRVSSISWNKFYQNIKIELAKHPSERMDPKQMLKMSKEEFDRLIETSPNIPEKIIEQFKTSFDKLDHFDKIIKPEICDILIPTSEFRNPWFNEENQTKVINDNLKIQLVKQTKIHKQQETNKKLINDFVKLFIDLNNREPMESEVVDNLKDKMNAETIRKILDDNKSMTLSVKIDHVDNNSSVFHMV
ncbi:MAG: SLATT domain-containing protein [Flavobacterium sp.]